MFKHTDAAAYAEEAALTAVMADRSRFDAYFRAAEEYGFANNLVVAGEAATRLLLGAPFDKDFYSYELLADQARAHAHARAIAKIFATIDPEGVGRYAHLRIEIPSQVFVIEVDERPLFVLRALPTRKAACLASAIIPSFRPARFASTGRGNRAPLQIRCVGPEIRLIETYAALSNPDRAASWAGLLGAEKRLRALFASEIEGKIEKATAEGGAAGTSPAAVRDLIRALLRDYVCRAGLVLVGPYATGLRGGNFLVQSHVRGTPRIQVVTDRPLADEAAAVRAVADGLSLKVEVSVSPVHVPSDPDLQRMTMYVTNAGDRRVPFLDVFDTGARELVPFTAARLSCPMAGGRPPSARGRQAAQALTPPPGARLGTFFVLLRFRLVDIWSMQLLLLIGAVRAPFTRQRLGDFVRDFSGVAAEFSRAAADPARYAEIFPEDTGDYAGDHVNPVIAGKRARFVRQKSAPRFVDYYPAREPRPAHQQAGRNPHSERDRGKGRGRPSRDK